MAEKKDVLEEGVGINMAFKFYSKAANTTFITMF